MLKIVHVELKQANTFVSTLHRHHKPVIGHRYSIGAIDGSTKLVGVAIVGRPVSRELDYTKIVEVTRLCTDGTKNACSFLYSACARASKELGYSRIQTYILEDEPGITLRAAGWIFDGMTHAGTWNCNVRKSRREDQPMTKKQRWIKDLA